MRFKHRLLLKILFLSIIFIIVVSDCLTHLLAFFSSPIPRDNSTSDEERDVKTNSSIFAGLEEPKVELPSVIEKQVVIYAATNFYSEKLSIRDELFLNDCPPDVQRFCRITENEDELEIADAVVYHNRDFYRNRNYTMVGLSKPQIMFTKESPSNERLRFPKDSINWTMTFRRDSDIFTPYGFFTKRKSEILADLDKLWETKDENVTAVWMASNCETLPQRERIISSAMNFGLKVDIYGACGQGIHVCDMDPYGRRKYECAAKYLRKYKFYFALENTICEDYVSEKFYNALKNYYAVPIVIQRKIHENLGIPGESFIALDDFPTVKRLTEYILAVEHNKEVYLKYHTWRDKYEIQIPLDFGFCELCRRLQHPIIHRKSYFNLRDWFSEWTCNSSASWKYVDVPNVFNKTR